MNAVTTSFEQYVNGYYCASFYMDAIVQVFTWITHGDLMNMLALGNRFINKKIAGVF